MFPGSAIRYIVVQPLLDSVCAYLPNRMLDASRWDPEITVDIPLDKESALEAAGRMAQTEEVQIYADGSQLDGHRGSHIHVDRRPVNGKIDVLYENRYSPQCF